MPELLEKWNGIYGMNFDYSLESIINLDKVINDCYKIGHEPSANFVLALGFYLGETIIKNIKGTEWINCERDNPFELKIKQKVEDWTYLASPMDRVIDYFGNREKGLTPFVQVFGGNADGTIKPGISTDGWVDMGNGTIYRSKYVTEEDKNKGFIDKIKKFFK